MKKKVADIYKVGEGKMKLCQNGRTTKRTITRFTDELYTRDI